MVYRTATSQPGHHQTALQTLPKTPGLTTLDALRKQRKLNDCKAPPSSTPPLRNA